MTYILSALLAVLLATGAYLAVEAFRSGHLLPLSHRSTGTMFLERDTDGRYTLVEPVHIPAAVLRFARSRAEAAVRTTPERVAKHAPGQLFRALQKPARGARAAHV